MTEKFTQGEWVVDDNYSTMLNVTVKHDKHNETGICEVDCSWVWDEHNEYQNDPTDEELANAHLIAAAPKMYRELLGWVEILDRADFDVSGIRSLLAEARGESKDN